MIDLTIYLGPFFWIFFYFEFFERINLIINDESFIMGFVRVGEEFNETKNLMEKVLSLIIVLQFLYLIISNLGSYRGFTSLEDPI